MAAGQVLYRKWRPQKFADVVGQDHVKQTIINSIKAGKVSHAYLFAGPRGTGKTSMARLVAKAVNCLENKDGEPCGKCNNCKALASGRMIDLIEIDAASHTGVDDVRDLVEKINLAPGVGKYKVYIIDEVHMLTKNAFNALLKTLEEPPAHALFILATTEVHKLLPTVVSRCQYFDFHYLLWDEIIAQLKKITAAEKISITDDALAAIAENSEGSLRDALSILDQVVSLEVDKIDRKALEKLLGIVDNNIVRELTQAVLDKNVVGGIEIINQTYFKGYDVNQLAKRWLSYLRELLMVRLGNEDLVERSADEKKQMMKQAQQMSANELINLLQRLVEAINCYKIADMPQLALEMVMVQYADLKKVKSAEQKVELEVVKKDNPVSVNSKLNLQLWQQLYSKISEVNPALGALMKNSRARLSEDKLIIEAPSQFLRDTINKPNNLQVIVSNAAELEIKVIQVECIVLKEPDKTVDKVAEVFDIMQS